jgi:hypothetical protein
MYRPCLASASKEVIAAGAIEYLSGTLSIPSDDVHMASLATIANIALNGTLRGD